MTLRKPKALQPGSHIRVVTPASPLTLEQIESGVRFLESQDYSVSLAENVFAKSGYLAGPDEARAADLTAAFMDEDVDCVMCSRGGYGCARIMPFLDVPALAATNKMLCGFSDVTTLHLAFNRAGLATVHSPMMITLSVPREDWVYESMAAGLSGSDPFVSAAPAAETLVPGTATGVSTGGCLCLMTDSFGTDYELDCAGKIVFIEDVDELPHRVDAMFTNLVNNGQLKRAAGIVIGEMTGTDEKADEKIGKVDWRSIVQDRVVPLGIPAVVNFPFGHMKSMLTVPMGVEVTLDATSGRLGLAEAI